MKKDGKKGLLTHEELAKMVFESLHSYELESNGVNYNPVYIDEQIVFV